MHPEFLTYCVSLGLLFGCTRTETRVARPPTTSADVTLKDVCAAQAGEARVETVGDRVLVARSFDLANVALIKTSAGHVVIDASMSPTSGKKIRAALTAQAPGDIKALILTHSHLDHVGGASAFIDEGTEVWATDAFTDHFLKQYGLFQPIEMLRGSRQYGIRTTKDILPCTSLGPLPDFAAASRSGARLPTRTFSRQHRLTVGDVVVELVEAHGETHDTLFAWLPEQKILFPGDNLYKAFPNLYTIRGTSARPVAAWIESLDAMRRLEPEALVPGHTEPIIGKEKVREVLTAYRDGIQWVLDATVRGAAAGLSPDQLAEIIKLPPALASHPYLQELYGQVDWSVRGIYSDHLGWFGGDAADLATPRRTENARREISLMGGPAQVLETGEAATKAGDTQWAVHLLSKLRDSGLTSGALHERLGKALATALQAAAAETPNTNGRGYLAESALEILNGRAKLPNADPDETFLKELPLPVFLARLGTRLIPGKSEGVHESLRLEFPDVGESYTITVRGGVAEIAAQTPLPGTPAPVAVVKMPSLVWKKLALKQVGVAAVLAQGELKVEGSWAGFLTFMRRFEVE